MNYYHPTTLEHIKNPLPAVADWAGATALPVPAYDTQMQQCMFVDGAWKVEAVSLERPIEELKIEALGYLASTDWYYARLAETGQEVPEDVLTKRLAARAYLNEVQ